MKKKWKFLTALLMIAVLVLSLTVCVSAAGFKKKKKKNNSRTSDTVMTDSVADGSSAADLTVDEDGEYTSKEEVALYLHTYGKLPGNFITKRDAQDLGWEGGSLEWVAPGKSIGGGRFGNYEGNLPEKDGRQYYECDIDYDGGKRNAKRIVWSNDGLIYYTEDHYKTFERLY